MSGNEIGNIDTVWIFCGDRGDFPSGVFFNLNLAEEWIAKHRLTGVLTQYPGNTGIYDWMIKQGHFQPNSAQRETPRFIGRFSSAFLAHYHYLNGNRQE